jgi:hypothetical protein
MKWKLVLGIGILIGVVVLIVLVSAEGGTYSYTFLDMTNNKAFNDTGQNIDPFGGVELDAQSYLNIQSDNEVYAHSTSGGNNQEPVVLFNFTINETIANINWIYVLINGYENANPEGGTVFVYNYTASTWSIVVGVIPTSDGDISVNFTSGFETMIESGSNEFSVGIIGSDFDNGESVFMDFINVTVDDYSADGDCWIDLGGGATFYPTGCSRYVEGELFDG